MLKKREPGLVERIMGFFAPAVKAETRGLFEGAAKTARTRYWMPSNQSVNDDLPSIRTLRARSRALLRNDGWALSGVEGVVSETIGAGIIPQAVDDDKALVDQAEALWKAWGDTTLCDADGVLDFYGMQALVMKTMVEAGEVLVRRRWRFPEDGLPVPIQLQVLEPDFLDYTKDTFTTNERGNLILNGIEFDRLGRRVGYHLYKVNPTRSDGAALESVFVPASDVLHVYRVDRAGQVVGVPWLHAVITKLRDLGEFTDAELMKQKVGALHAGFIIEPDAPETPTALTAAQQREQSRMEPGSMTKLRPGEDVRFSSPPPTSAYREHVPWELRAVATSLGVTYETVTGDYSRSNFSSSRMGRLRMMRNIDRWQRHVVIPRLCDPVYRWFVEAAIFANLMRKAPRVLWSTPRREMIDPVKETTAIEKGIRIGVMTLHEAIRQTGNDFDEVMKERAEELAELDRLKIATDSDPRRDKAPTAPPPPAADDGDDEEEETPPEEGDDLEDA